MRPGASVTGQVAIREILTNFKLAWIFSEDENCTQHLVQHGEAIYVIKKHYTNTTLRIFYLNGFVKKGIMSTYGLVQHCYYVKKDIMSTYGLVQHCYYDKMDIMSTYGLSNIAILIKRISCPPMV